MLNRDAAVISTRLSGLPFLLNASPDKRSLGSVTYSPAPVNFNTSLVLNETSLFSDEYFTAAVDSGDLTISVTVGATIVYNVLKSELGESRDLFPLDLFLLSHISCYASRVQIAHTDASRQRNWRFTLKPTPAPRSSSSWTSATSTPHITRRSPIPSMQAR